MELSGKCPTCGRGAIRKRTTPQNRYYWSCIVEPLSDHLGYTKEETHDLLKIKFLTQVRHAVNKRNGQIIELVVVGSTTDLGTQEACDLYADIRCWASQELDCYLMEPNEGVYDA